MPTCRECKFYEQVDETKGNCFGHDVQGDRDTSMCPTRTFRPKK